MSETKQNMGASSQDASVICDPCGAEGPEMADTQKALAAWNERAEAAPRASACRGAAVIRSAERAEVYAAIDSERAYQNRVWQDAGGAPNPLSIGEFILSIEQYASQARAVWSQEPKPEVGALDIIRKIAGIAVNCMEQHGAPHRASAIEAAAAGGTLKSGSTEGESAAPTGETPSPHGLEGTRP